MTPLASTIIAALDTAARHGAGGPAAVVLRDALADFGRAPQISGRTLWLAQEWLAPAAAQALCLHRTRGEVGLAYQRGTEVSPEAQAAARRRAALHEASLNAILQRWLAQRDSVLARMGEAA